MQNNVAAFDSVFQYSRVWCGRIAEILAESVDPDWLADGILRGWAPEEPMKPSKSVSRYGTADVAVYWLVNMGRLGKMKYL